MVISTDGTSRSLHIRQILLSPSRLFTSKSFRERIALHFEHTFVFNSFRLPVEIRIMNDLHQGDGHLLPHLCCHRTVSRRRYSWPTVRFLVFSTFPRCHRRSRPSGKLVRGPTVPLAEFTQNCKNIRLASNREQFEIHRIQNSGSRFPLQDIAKPRDEFYSITLFHRRLQLSIQRSQLACFLRSQQIHFAIDICSGVITFHSQQCSTLYRVVFLTFVSDPFDR